MFDEINKNDGDKRNIFSGPAPAKDFSVAGAVKEGQQQKQPVSAGQPGQAGAEDIFKETDYYDDLEPVMPTGSASGSQARPTAIQSGKLTPVAMNQSADEQTEEQPLKTGSGKKIIIILSAVVLVVLAGASAWYVYGRFFAVKQAARPVSQTDNNTDNKDNVQTEAAIDNEVLPETQRQPEEIFTSEPAQFIDSDQDGLGDDEEAGLGTDKNSVDSDNDGLFDREEVKVYGTDPLNPDSDNDGYADGQEVKSGYNPRGAGKLYEIP